MQCNYVILKIKYHSELYIDKIIMYNIMFNFTAK